MKDLQLYQELLGLCATWRVTDVQMNLPAQEITVTVACAEGQVWACPACSHRLHVQGWEERTWRHLDTCQCRTLLTALVPRQSSSYNHFNQPSRKSRCTPSHSRELRTTTSAAISANCSPPAACSRR